MAAGGGSVRGMGVGETIQVLGSELCGNCTVLEGQIHLTNAADGSPVDEKIVYNHHILTNGPRLEFPLKPAGGGLNLGMAGGFVGAGGDNGNTPFMYYSPSQPQSIITGYQMVPKTVFSTNVVLVNKSPKPQAVKVNYELEYIPGKQGRNVRSALISAAIMPSATKATRSAILEWQDDGIFLYGKGHLRK